MIKKILIVVVVLAIFGAFFGLGLNKYFSFDYIKENKVKFEEFYLDNAGLTIGLYMVVYIVMAALSLPGAAIMTLLGGALFGLVVGTVLVSFSSTIGATAAFLAARYILREPIQKKFADRLQAINSAFEKEGAFYLFTVRLIPAVPFFVINLVMGLTPIKTWTFYWVSQVGMLIGTLVYVNAGTQISQIESTSGLLSPSLIASFVALGVTPLVLKKVMEYIRAKNPKVSKEL
jgi:uncharacterized membrane protein YdjX (TVP38/TMEM64 family)